MKKEVLRMCIVCRQMKDKHQLIRIVKQADGKLALDFTGKLEGRGAYICKDAECANKLIKSKALNKTYKQNISEDVANEIKEGIIERINQA